MEFDKKTLESITDFGYAHVRLKDIADILECNLSDLQNELKTNSKFRAALYKGRKQAVYQLQYSIMKAAVNGSSPAQTMAQGYIADVDSDDSD